MNVLSLAAGLVLATGSIVSPLSETHNISPQTQSSKPRVSFGQLALPTPTLTPTPLAKPDLAPPGTPQPTASPTRKKHFTVAVLGDSMVDTLGPGVPHLKKQLTATFPSSAFTVLNYGVGSTNIDYGLTRLTNGYTYLGTNLPALISQQPDLVVVESFAYNPYPNDDPGNIDRHWLQLAAIINTLKQQLPAVKIVVAATIAPNSKIFCDGAPGIAFSAEEKQKRTNVIKQYLESTIKFAKGEHVPLADAYHASLNANGDGKTEYINAGDHIHPSDAGKTLFAQKVTEVIINYRLFL